MSSSDVSPLSLPGSPPSPAFSELSLNDGASVWDDSKVETSSIADTADSCCSTSCCPPPDAANDFKPHRASPDSTDPQRARCDSSSTPVSIDEAAFTPLVIIGAGPHALALAARLSEPRPAALYSDLEHARLAWLQREDRGRRDEKARRRTVKGHWGARRLVEPAKATLAGLSAASSDDDDDAVGRPAIQVLDSSGPEWLARWDSYFTGLGIKHLRSPMLFHPSPADADALVAYAQREDREDELLPIKGVVGAELSRHQRKKRTQRIGRAPLINERERQDYHRPSTLLFRSFIADDLVSRYSTAPLVAHATVTSVSFGKVHVQGRKVEDGFVVRSRGPDGTEEIRGARAVVLAVGPSEAPNVPRVIREAVSPARDSDSDGDERVDAAPWRKGDISGEGWCHSSAFAVPGLRPMDGPLGARVKQGLPTRVVVLGGGLTSAQIVDSLLEAGVAHVTLLCRSRIKVKHFDFDLEWVSKYANLSKMAFYGETCPAARARLIRDARGGGSVNPHFWGVLKRHVKSGRLELRTGREVERAGYEGGKWTLGLRRTGGGGGQEGEVGAAQNLSVDEGDDEAVLSDVDYLVCATGSTLDLSRLACVQPLLASHPIELVQGLPRLTPDLQWRPDVPFFVCGAYAMLELGPDALNLSGTRPGAERIAHALGALGTFDDVPGGGVRDVAGAARRRAAERKQRRSGGEGNFFEGLEVEGGGTGV